MRLSFLCLAALLSGCGPITFNTQLKGEAVIQGSPLGSLLGAFPQLSGFANINFDENQDFKNNDARKANVKSLKVKGLSLRIVSPTTQDFSFLETLEFYARAGDQETKVAGKTGIDQLGLAAPNPTLKLDVVDAELVQYLQAPTMTIVTRGTGRQPPQETRLEATLDLAVGVGL